MNGKTIDSNWPKVLTALKIGLNDVSLVDVSSIDSEYSYLGIDNAAYINESEWDSGNNEIVPKARVGKSESFVKRKGIRPIRQNATGIDCKTKKHSKRKGK